jgi:hypothetical protein
MKIQYFHSSSLIVSVFALLVLGPVAHANEASHLDAQMRTIPSVVQLESQFNTQLTTRDELYGQPRATSYYDDLVDHYEQDQLMRDVIAENLR